MSDTPTPEAIVKAAIEQVAEKMWCACSVHEDILALASDQAEVAQIIQNAGGQTDPYLYAVGYDVGFEDGFKEAQGRIKELEAENKKLRLEVYHANDVADVSIDKAKDLEAKLAKAVKGLEAISSDMCEPRDDASAFLTCQSILAELKRGSDD